MSRLNKRELVKILGPLRRRMHVNNALRCVLASLAAAGCAAVVLSFVSLWLPVPFLMYILLQIYLAGLAAGILVSVFLSPGLNKLITAADSLGLKERTVTAWQLREDESPVAELQRKDARQAILNTDFKRLYPLRFPVKLSIVFAATVALVVASLAVPGFAREDAKRIEELKTEVKEQTEALEKAAEEVGKNDALTAKELEKIREEIDKLKAELKKAKTEEDALKALSRAENELDKMDWKKQLNQLGEALSSSEMTKDLGTALKNESMSDMKQALEKLQQQLEDSEISKEELAEMLEKAAEQLENKEISEKLKQEADKLASAEDGSQSNAMQSLSGELSAMMQQQGRTGANKALGQLSQALQQAKGAVSQVDNRLGSGSKVAQGGKQGGSQPGKQGNGSKGNKGSGNGEQGAGGNGGQNGQSGSQSGSGMGQSEKGGGGAGDGSTNKDAGNTGSDGSGASRKPGDRKEEDYERLYDPDRLGGENTPDFVNGQKLEEGQSQYTQVDNMPVQKGAVLPYREVLTKYRDEAASYMEDTDIPAAMKQIVREYFESLE